MSANREIKFRGLQYREGGPIWLYGNLIEKDDPTKKEPTPWVRLIHNRALDAQMVLFSSVGQFTGLKDKNGREIYEGDIVTLSAGAIQNIGKRMPIIFCEGAFCLEYKDHQTGLITYKDQCIENVEDFYHDDDVGQFIEVLGNIHEHPQLLNSES